MNARFAFPAKSRQLVMAGSLAAFAGWLAWEVTIRSRVGPWEGLGLLGVAGLGFVARGLSLRRILSLRQLDVEISRRGIRSVRSPQWLAWRDGREVRGHWRHAEVIGANGESVVIDFGLANAARLLNIIGERIAPASGLPKEFARGPLGVAWTLAAVAVVTSLCGALLALGTPGSIAASIGLLAVGVWQLGWRDSHRVRVESDAIVVRSFLRSQCIPMAEVRSVALTLDEWAIGPQPRVTLRTDVGELRIDPLGTDAFVLARAIRSSLRARGGDGLHRF